VTSSLKASNFKAGPYRIIDADDRGARGDGIVGETDDGVFLDVDGLLEVFTEPIAESWVIDRPTTIGHSRGAEI
jgi:hypothetical protein